MPNSITLLVCDDDEDTRDLIGQALQLLGYNVEFAVDGQAAIELCQRREFDLILMDILMPRLNGIDFVRWMKVQTGKAWTPVILVTALDDVRYRVEGLEAGADDYLVKPFELRELEARVAALLRTRQLMREIADRNNELLLLNEERSRLQDALVKRERTLAVSQLAGAAAHGLLQPLTILQLALHQLEPLFGSQSAIVTSEMRLAFETIKQQLKEMTGTIQQLPRVDSNAAVDYVHGEQILSLASGKEEKR